MMDGDLSLRILQTLTLVLSWVANGYSEPAKAAA